MIFLRYKCEHLSGRKKEIVKALFDISLVGKCSALSCRRVSMVACRHFIFMIPHVCLCIAMPTMLAISGQLYWMIVTNHWMGAVYASVLPVVSTAPSVL